MTYCDPYPVYAIAERRADGAVHVIGVVLSVLGTALMNVRGHGVLDPGLMTALNVYGAAMIASFVVSTCYHFTPWERVRPLLRRIDHAVIYLKIAGTYTPFVVLIGSTFGYVVLALVWLLAAIGMVMKLAFWGRPTRWDVALYLGLGWLSVALLPALIPLVPGVSLGLMLAGGLIYSSGAVVFSLQALRFQNAIWHGFVVVASGCYYAAIYLSVFGGL